MAKTTNGKKVRSVDEYCSLLKLADRSDVTIRNYRTELGKYAKFLNVPIGEVHNNLSVENLMSYAASIKGSKNTRKLALTVLHRYMSLNGVEFDELEFNATKVQADETRDDKPLELQTLQKMMDLGNPHSRALLAFMTSTGCRAGETSKLLLSDVHGDSVVIPNEIAKRKKGGTVYLTSEAREYLDLWLKERPHYIEKADKMTAKLLSASTGQARVSRKGIGKQLKRPDNDQRLFACSYSTIDKIFGRLYRAADGEKGKYRAKVTSHACRAFFRTNASKMGVDLIEGILRHSGYLNAAYVRMTPEERYKQFHAGEASLYITRKDHRIQTGELDALKAKNEELEHEMQQLRAILEVHESPAPVMKAIVPKNLPPEQAAAINAAIKNLNDVLASIAQ